MKKINSVPVILSIILSVAIACGVFYRIVSYKAHFDTVVNEALKTSDGYDQQFIDMVNRLERELALRANFGYTGEKDPMTGQVRSIVKAPAPTIAQAVSVEVPRVAKGKILPSLPKKEPVIKKEPVVTDPFRLSAIIYDEQRSKYTAVIMVGERSLSVETGDQVAGRTVKSITASGIEMNDSKNSYIYDVSGRKDIKPLSNM